MKAFTHGGRIIVNGKHILQGKAGTVQRKLTRDNGAWVRMDEPLPSELVSFSDPTDARHRDILLFPDQCRPEKTGGAS